MASFFRLLLGGVVGVLLVAACSDDETAPVAAGDCQATTDWVQSEIFAASCTAAGCHSATEPAAGLDLETPDALGRLLEQPAATCDRTLVVPGDPDQSLLYEKLLAASPECGERMPIGAPLADVAIACVAEWIAAMPTGCETCGGAGCADLDTDVQNCGACGNACPTGASCASGSCACSGDATVCAGACADTTSDPAHCGGCDMPCNGMLVCSLGSCKADCDNGLLKCGSACVDSMSDPNNCGGCDVSCGTGACEAGLCNCGQGIDTQTDPENCGGCGNVCPAGNTCEAGACVCGMATVSFSADVQPIFTAKCATNGCHKGVMPQQGLDLTAGKAHAETVNVAASECSNRMRVLPGDPANSYLIDKILGVDLCMGEQMPKLGGVSNAQIETMSNWICGGALDN